MAAASAGAVLGSVLFVRAQSSGHLFSAVDVPPAPVALALGAQVRPDGTPSGFLAARLDLARRLFETGKVEVILVSGDNGAKEYNEPEAMREYLIDAGIPGDRVVCDYAGFDTYDSCYRARTVFGVEKVIIVSQSYHLPRAVATARLLGLDASGVGDDTVRRAGRPWRKGWVRDQVASVKTILDLLTARTPVLGEPELGVTVALFRR
jgi:vancomycin permeability regulator SanA